MQRRPAALATWRTAGGEGRARPAEIDQAVLLGRERVGHVAGVEAGDDGLGLGGGRHRPHHVRADRPQQAFQSDAEVPRIFNNENALTRKTGHPVLFNCAKVDYPTRPAEPDVISEEI